MHNRIKQYGRIDKLPPVNRFKTGDLSLSYESGNLRNIFFGKTEVARMIYAAVRDHEWITVVPEIINERVLKDKSGIHISYQTRYRNKEIDFSASFSIAITPDNRIVAEMNGTAGSTFRKNRIGFCLLHPVTTCAGRHCLITSPDGSITSGEFPVLVAPHQPFKNIAAMRWMPDNHTTIQVRFYGDVFETEDQRNWTDDSYKTYCTPLDKPLPAMVNAGSEIWQKIELSVMGIPPSAAWENNSVLHITGEILGNLPEIGIGCSSRAESMTEGEAQVLRNIHFSHLRGEVHLFFDRFDSQLTTIRHESDMLNLPVELCLFFGSSPQEEFQKLLKLLKRQPLNIRSITLFDEKVQSTPDVLIASMVPVIRKWFKGLVGAGTNCNFAQLNRKRPDTTLLDFICFSVQPQEHASDHKSMIENSAAQQYVAASAKTLAGHCRVHVSPVTLQRRFNANIINYEVNHPALGLPEAVDPRQMSLFGKVWTVCSLKYLIESGIDSLTYYETLGERGILMGQYDTRWPQLFHSAKNRLFPVFHVFRHLMQQTNCQVIRTISSRPDVLDGFAVITSIYGLVFMSNLTLHYQDVTLTGAGKHWTLLRIQTDNYTNLTRIPARQHSLQLDPLLQERGEFRLAPLETRVIQYIRM